MHTLLHLLTTIVPNRKMFGNAIRFATIAFALTASLAHANPLPATIDFTLTPTNGIGGTYFFSAPQNPNTGQAAGDGFFYASPIGTGGFFAGSDTVFFITAGSIYTGNIQLINSDFSTQIFFYGPQLFTGTEDSPTYLLGSFLLTNLTVPGGYPVPDGDQVGQSYNLVVSQESPVAVTPEPSSLILLSTGLLGTIATFKRRFQKA